MLNKSTLLTLCIGFNLVSCYKDYDTKNDNNKDYPIIGKWELVTYNDPNPHQSFVFNADRLY